MKNNLFSVKEVAEKLGVTKQAVYKRINQPKNKQFTQRVGNKTYVTARGLEFFDKQSQLSVENKVEDNEYAKLYIKSLTDRIEELEKTVDFQREQITSDKEKILLLESTEEEHEVKGNWFTNFFKK